MRMQDLTGYHFGKLTVVARAPDHISSGGNKTIQWLCKCDCGNETVVSGAHLKSGHTTSCGCAVAPKSLIGKRFGHLVVLELSSDWYISPDGKHREARWKCKCDCGSELDVRGGNLRRGVTKSCGCTSRREPTAHAKVLGVKHRDKHGHTCDERYKRLYKAWVAMRQRCYNPNNRSYYRYGGRGITVCDEWSEYEPFAVWALAHGYSVGLSIDRIDNDSGYSPGNCRWATQAEQARNRSTTVFLSDEGCTHSIPEWSDITGISGSIIYKRVYELGWDVHRALTEASDSRHTRCHAA